MERASLSYERSTGYDLISFRKRIYSQYGEEGILFKILDELGIEKGSFVEFGAGDGVTLSNTKVFADAGWQGVCIEPDDAKFGKLEQLYRKNPSVEAMQCFVDVRGDGCLDSLLAGTKLPADIDIMSIDIDGNEYHIWDSLQHYRPKVVLIETNFTFPFNLEFIQKEGLHIGSSALALYRLGLRKGYTLVAYNFINCFFVRNPLAALLNLRNRSFAYLYFTGIQGGVTGFLVSDYDGNWHATVPVLNVWGKDKIEIMVTNQKLIEMAAQFRFVDDPVEIGTLFEPF